MTAARPIPLVVVTGFLGSGKTTLLSRLLKEPEAEGTLVLVNEIGEVGLDHDLLWSGGEVPLLLENGCVCCSVGDDLASLLEDLFWARLERRMPRFDRVVLETTGLADPRGIAAALRSRPLVAERFAHAGTVTIVAATDAPAVLDAHAEAEAQVALADRLVITKTDLATDIAVQAVEGDLARRNPLAERIRATAETGGSAALLTGAEAREIAGLAAGAHDHRHGADLATFTIPLAEPTDARTAEEALGALAATAPRLLRAKGAVRIGGALMLVEIAGGTVSPLRPWPGAEDPDATGRLVVIGRGLARDEVRAALGPLAG